MSTYTRRFLAAFVGLAMLLLPGGVQLASAGGTVNAAPATWHIAAGMASQDQAIQGMVFLPKEIWVNVGDTVTWTIQSGEPHTVTFLAQGQQRPQFDENDPKQVQPQGSSNYDGTSYYNSGLMAMGSPNTSYSLTFTQTGDFHYVCLLHMMMDGMVHVRPAGTSYPYSQAQYDQQSAQQVQQLQTKGQDLITQAKNMAAQNHNLVVAGIGGGDIMIARFYPETINVRPGDTVTFTNYDTEAPHTVTFGEEPPGGPGATMQPYGNAKAYDGSQPLNSGWLGTGPNPPFAGKSFTVTFTKAGTYHYICALHDELGMVGDVVVGAGMPGTGSGSMSAVSGSSTQLQLFALVGLATLLAGGLVTGVWRLRRANR